MQVLQVIRPTAVDAIDVRLTYDEATLIRALTAYTPAAVANAFGVKYDVVSAVCQGFKKALNQLAGVPIKCTTASNCLVFLPYHGDVDNEGFQLVNPHVVKVGNVTYTTGEAATKIEAMTAANERVATENNNLAVRVRRLETDRDLAAEPAAVRKFPDGRTSSYTLTHAASRLMNLELDRKRSEREIERLERILGEQRARIMQLEGALDAAYSVRKG